MAGGRKLSLTTRYVLLFGILLLLANSVLGVVTLGQSTAAMKALIEKDMLDIVNSAAALLDGDALEKLTKDDVEGPAFKHIEDQLLVFQNSTDIEFIYAFKQVGDDEFVFTVDPDPVDPGAFGEEVVTTSGMIEAGKGIPAVDSAPAADRWGSFYSAFSPVLNSSGEVAGIIGVDFDTQWYDDQVTYYTASIAVVTSLSVVLAGVTVALITNRVRLRFRDLDKGLSELSVDVDALMGEMASYSGFSMSDAQRASDADMEATDELERLGTKIQVMQDDMRLYLDYLQAQAYTDALTKVGNSAAYHEEVRDINASIAQGAASFAVAVIDINGLKELNDTHGHECGDYYIQATAQALMQGFDKDSVFRIGGDEFAIVVQPSDGAAMEEGLGKVTKAIRAFNATSRYPATLAVSRGVATYKPDEDASFRDVFARADAAMYSDKRAYYSEAGGHNRRRPR